MVNSVYNTVAIVLLFFLSISMVIGYTITNRLESEARTAMAGFDLSPEYANYYSSYKSFMLGAFQFFQYFMVGLIIFTSFVSSTNLRLYIITIIASSLLCIILSHAVSLIWNVFATNTALDFTDFPASDLWFITGIQNIFIVNLLAGLASFVFSKKGEVRAVSYA